MAPIYWENIMPVKMVLSWKFIRRIGKNTVEPQAPKEIGKWFWRPIILFVFGMVKAAVQKRLLSLQGERTSH